MYCPNCGAQIPDGSTYCKKCGKPMKRASRKSKTGVKGILLALIVLCILALAFVYFVMLPKIYVFSYCFSQQYDSSEMEKLLEGAFIVAEEDNSYTIYIPKIGEKDSFTEEDLKNEYNDNMASVTQSGQSIHLMFFNSGYENSFFFRNASIKERLQFLSSKYTWETD